jgi:hypothetical protein
MLLLLSALLLLTLDINPAPSFKVERTLMYVGAAADITTTRLVIKNGGKEVNPILVKLFGKKPSTLQLISVKAVSIGIAEITVHYLKKQGKYGQAKFVYWMNAALNFFVAGMNLRYVW